MRLRTFDFIPLRTVVTSRWCLALLLVGLALGGCAGHAPNVSGPSRYVAIFTATRLPDHSPLVSTTVPLLMDKMANLRTDSRVASEDRPALPQFSAKLVATNTRGAYQIITKVSVLEVSRNKKGKLKRSKRFEGALLPIKLGEKQLASPVSDPVQIEVRVEAR